MRGGHLWVVLGRGLVEEQRPGKNNTGEGGSRVRVRTDEGPVEREAWKKDGEERRMPQAKGGSVMRIQFYLLGGGGEGRRVGSGSVGVGVGELRRCWSYGPE